MLQLLSRQKKSSIVWAQREGYSNSGERFGVICGGYIFTSLGSKHPKHSCAQLLICMYFCLSVSWNPCSCDHVVSAVLFYRSGGKWCRGAGERDHLLDGQTEFESVQRVADANLPLDLRVWQSWHDGSTLHIGTAGCHVPCWHTHPQLVRVIRVLGITITLMFDITVLHFVV